jgi:glucose-1-phosphate thymidylyltransferase
LASRIPNRAPLTRTHADIVAFSATVPGPDTGPVRPMSTRRGIVLAGGAGSRLYPATQAVSKQLLAVYDKPMVYYPLSTLMLANVRDVLVISTPRDLPQFEHLLGDGSQFGLRISYRAQPSPDGLAQAFLIGEQFIDGQPVALVLGDNIFYGHGLGELLQHSSARLDRATIYGYYVRNPQRYGVIEFDHELRPVSIVEKPDEPPSNYAATGLYFYPGDVSARAATLTPSSRGELEITDLNRQYMAAGMLDVELLGRGYAWLDTGTHESMLQASNYVEALESRQGLKVACLEEIAWRQGWISAEQVMAQAERYRNNDYGEYLRHMLERPAR